MSERWIRCDRGVCGSWQLWRGTNICIACEEAIGNWQLAKQVSENISREVAMTRQQAENKLKKNAA